MDFRPYEEWQIELCNKLNVEYYPLAYDLRIGISANLDSGEIPINGLRHPPYSPNVTGWFLWAGLELSHDSDFFFPIKARDIVFWSEVSLKYLGLPPGWRFLFDDHYEDIWYDEKLFSI